MTRKTISITREAYDRLRARKGRDESFTHAILRLTDRKPLANHAGRLSKSSVKAIRNAIDEARRERRARDIPTLCSARGSCPPGRHASTDAAQLSEEAGAARP